MLTRPASSRQGSASCRPCLGRPPSAGADPALRASPAASRQGSASCRPCLGRPPSAGADPALRAWPATTLRCAATAPGIVPGSRSVPCVIREGLPVPHEPGYGSKRSLEGEAQRTCREPRPGGPRRTSGDGTWAALNRLHPGRRHPRCRTLAASREATDTDTNGLASGRHSAKA
jgi:hypothetical protein